VSKRTLISHTPNILIVHLQRIIFNFDTFRNEKVNTRFEFPNYLDLTPYSLKHITKMEKEEKKGEEKGQKDEEMEHKDDSDEDENDIEGAEKKEENKEEKIEGEDECYEYKLVGVTVHVGTADAGHYYSYINTARGKDGLPSDDPNWEKTEDEPWKEYNDSTVKEYSFSDMKVDCFGGGESSGSSGGGGIFDLGGWFKSAGGGSSYGKSAYMLIYERREKKPIKVLTSEAPSKTPDSSQKTDAKDGTLDSEVTADSRSQFDRVYLDEEKGETYKLADFNSVDRFVCNKTY
jgi:ubiquitin carboxyl-terminal hydrolase 34